LHQDNYGLEISCASDAALQAYLSGVDCALRFDAPGIVELRDALSHDEEFALAHAVLARQLLIHGFRTQSSEHMHKALELRATVTPRESAAIDVIDRACRFDPRAIPTALQHAQAWPQDVFALSHLLGPFGLLAFSGERDWQSQVVSLLGVTQSAYREDDWWHLTTRGFFGAETGDFEQGRRDCERAWTLSENGNCAHSLAHLHFEIGGIDEGTQFINDWMEVHGGSSDMRHHLIWHRAFLDLEAGMEIDEIFAVYDEELDPDVSDPMPLTTFTDNAAFLWRCVLSGKKASAAVNKALFAYADKHYANCGFYFADVHKAMAAALQDTSQEHTDLLQNMSGVADKRDNDVARSAQVFAASFGAFAKHDYDGVVNMLEPILADSVLLGGSNPQRRIVEDTYLEACMRAKQYQRAHAVLSRRNRPTSTFDQSLLSSMDA